ncbi:MAG: hydroxyacylglutathione hydrolase [Actinoplanes sp.]|nr:hydroxyacylglutathione hydrolase [Actinoplanes sp.]
MLVTGFPAEAFGTNCYVLAPAPGEQCLIVDPGVGVLDRLDEVIARHRLFPAAVLLTHGHFDHTFSVAPVCGARGITAYVHPADKEMLADPTLGLGASIDEMFGGRLTYTEPDDVAELTDGATLTLAGLEITVDHAPGHTGGSVLFRLPGAGSSWDAEQICLSGDVLFAGSIGRTDLPGGSTPTMLTSLREKILPLADDTVVLPGHGSETTIGRERAANPYLRDLTGAPSRGL